MKTKIPKTSLKSQNSLKDIEIEDRKGKFRRICSLRGVAFKRFSDNFKIIKKVDAEATMLLVKSYKDFKPYLALAFEVFNNEVDVLREFKQFNHSKEASEGLVNRRFVEFKEIFIEKTSDEEFSKIKGWKIFSPLEYVLYNPYYLTNIQFCEKHVIKHYDESEVSKILHDMIALIKELQGQGLTLSFKNFFIVYTEDGYKFLVDSFEADKFEGQETVSDQFKFAALVVYGLLKELICAYYDIRANRVNKLVELYEKRHLNQFDSIIDEIKKALSDDMLIPKEKIETTGRMLREKLEKYLNVLYIFRNSEIYLMDQPIFINIKRVFLEVHSNFDRISHLVNFLVQNIPKRTALEALSLKIPNCTLSNYDASKVVVALKPLSLLQHLFLDLSNNNVNDDIVECLKANLQAGSLSSFEVWLSDTNITEKGIDNLLSIIHRIPPTGLKNVCLELMNKEKPLLIDSCNWYTCLKDKTNLEYLKLNLA